MDTKHAAIFRAMKEAGLDPTNREHVQAFSKILEEEIDALPERALARFRAGDVTEAASLAAERFADGAQMDKMDKFKLHNDPSELFKLTSMSSGKAGRRAEIRTAAANAAARAGQKETATDLWNRAREAHQTPEQAAAQQRTHNNAPPAGGWNVGKQGNNIGVSDQGHNPELPTDSTDLFRLAKAKGDF